MPANQSKPFSPPSAAQVQAHLDRYPPRGPSKVSLLLPTFGLALIVFLMLRAQSAATFILSWCLLGALLVVMGVRARLARSLESEAAQIQEMTMWRRREDALRRAWRLLPRLVINPELHGRTVAAIAHNLESLGAHDAAIVAYDHLIKRLPDDHPVSVQLRVHRTMAELGAERLTDADSSLRRLRSAVEPYRGTPIGGSYRLASLIQQSRTHHDADAVEGAGELLDELRPLGIDAGYGHALMALAYVRLGETESPPENWRGHALQWWSRATLLVPVERLIERFSDLHIAAQRLAAQHQDASLQGMDATGVAG